MTSEYFGGFTGGSTGSLDAVEHYENSKRSREKEVLIRNVAEDLAPLLKIKNWQTAPASEIVNQIKTLIPDPKKSAVRGDAQSKYCLALANALNKRMGREVVNVKSPEAELCRAVHELVYSIFVPVRDEFVGTQISILNTLENMQIVRNTLNGIANTVRTRISESTDENLTAQLEPLLNMYKYVDDELGRQILVLNNVVNNVINPTTKTIADLTSEDKQLGTFITSLKRDLGTTDFGRYVALSVNGYADVAHVAKLVDEALKKVGLALKDYKTTRTATEMIDRMLQDFPNKNGKIDSELLAKFVHATNLVRNNSYLHSELVQADNVTGGLPVEQSLGKRIERQTKSRETLLRDFDRNLSDAFDKIATNIDRLAKSFGQELKPNEHLDALVASFRNLEGEEVNRENIVYSISGFNQDAVSRETRTRFLGYLDAAVRALSPLIASTSGEVRQALQNIKVAIEGVVQLVDNFHDIYLDPLTKVALPKSGGSEQVEGGDASTYVKLKTSINHLVFFFNVAKMRQNLAITGTKIDDFRSGYETILGDSIGDLVVKERKQYDDLRTELEHKNIKQYFIDHVANDAKEKAIAEKTIANILKFKKEQMQVKIDFLKTMEAIDIYLINFTDAIAKNPESVRDLEGMLKGVETIAKWYTDDSSDNIVKLFEYGAGNTNNFNGNYEANFTPCPEPNIGNEGYYKWVAGNIATLNNVKSPFMGHIYDVDKLITYAENAAKSVRVLDNIMSVFSKLGYKQEGKSFMPVGVMFKNLRKFLFHSALTMGLRDEQLPTLAKGAVSGIVDMQGVSNADTGINADLRNDVKKVDAITSADEARYYIISKFATAMTHCNEEVPAAAGNRPVDPTIYNSDKWSMYSKMFVMAVKAMVAKVFTVIGTHSAMTRPLLKNSGITPSRLILGGSVEAPQVIDEAMELYIRLPLLAEFYKSVFNNNKDYPLHGEDRRITMIPEAVNNEWREFVKIIFEDAKNVENGAYSEGNVRDLVVEINKIYKNYGDCKKALASFVDFINHAYGLIKKADLEAYKKSLSRTGAKQTGDPKEDLDYNLLGEEDQTGRGIAPSDRYETFGTLRTADRKVEYKWSDDWVKIVHEFRNSIDTELGNIIVDSKLDKHPKPSFDGTIDEYKRLLSKADNKFAVVLRAMQGVEQLNSVNYVKTLMFHESVVAPLTTLYNSYKIIKSYLNNVQRMNVKHMEQIIDKILDSYDGVKPLYEVFADQQGDLHKNQYLVYIKTGYKPHIYVEGKEETKDAVSTIPTAAAPPAQPTILRAFPSNSKADKFADRNILVYRGQYGAEFDLTWIVIQRLFTQHAATKLSSDDFSKLKEGVIRFVIDREALFKDLININFALGADLGGITDVRVSGDNLLVDYNLLVETHQRLFNQVKKNLELFRNIVSKDVIERYEKPSNKCSTAYLENELFDNIFRNMPDKYVGDTPISSFGFSAANEVVSGSFKHLINHRWNVLAKIDNGEFFRGPTDDGKEEYEKALHKHESEMLRDSYELPMAELLYWNPYSKVQEGKVEFIADGDAKHNEYNPANDNERNKFHYFTKDRNLLNNDDARKWPFIVIPNIERYDEDQDLKTLKHVQDTMDTILKEMSAILNITGVLPTSEVLLFGIKSGANTVFDNILINSNDGEAEYNETLGDQQIVNGFIAKLAGKYNYRFNTANLKSNVEKLLQLSTVAAAANLGGVAPIFKDKISSLYFNYAGLPNGYKTHVNNLDLRLVNFNANAPPALTQNQQVIVDRMVDLANKYNSFYMQRERIFKSTIRTPMTGRVELYNDPSSNIKFMHQTDADCFKAGLIPRFNEIMVKYIYQGWDISTQKLYHGLISGFGQGSNVAAVLHGECINDVDPWLVGKTTTNHNMIVGTPDKRVVFASVARTIRNILINTKRNGDPEFRYQNISDVPKYMKENMKMMLPGFEKLYRLVIKKAELLRQVAQTANLSRELPYRQKYGITDASAIATYYPTPESHPRLIKITTQIQANLNTLRVAVTDAGINVDQFNDIVNGIIVSNVQLAAANTTKVSEDIPQTAVLMMDIATAAAAGLTNEQYKKRVYNSLVKETMHDDGHRNPYYLHIIDNIENGYALYPKTGFSTRVNTLPPAIPVATARNETWVKGDPTKATITMSSYLSKICNNEDKKSELLYRPNSAYGDLTTEEAKRYYIDLLDELINTCNNINKCCTETYRELADEPKFMETGEGFIADYVSQHKNNPIMLVSQLQPLLKNFNETPVNLALPLHKNGEAVFKFMYGQRYIMTGKKLTPDYTPGMFHLLDQYNGISATDVKYDRAQFEEFVANHIHMIRYIADTKFYKSILDDDCAGYVKQNLIPQAAITAINTASAGSGDVYNNKVLPGSALFNVEGKCENESYTAKTTLEEIISITESSDHESTYKNITEDIHKKEKVLNNRKQARIQNILDMNIVPINPHALLREVPLINIINYSYTCDRMMQNAILETNENIVDPDTTNVNYPREMLNKLIIHPYCHVDQTKFLWLVSRLSLGDTDAKLGRPKFISDQLWGKLLLQSQLPTAGVAGIPLQENNNLREGIPAAVASMRGINNNAEPANKDDALDALYGNHTGAVDYKYVKVEDGKHKIARVNISNIKTATDIGYLRFNTLFVRNLYFLCNIQRVMRMVMREEVAQLEAPVVSDVLNRRITDFEGAEQRSEETFEEY